MLDFIYSPDRQCRKTELKKNNVLQKTIIFAGDYESITENGMAKQLYYINGGEGLAAVYVKGIDDLLIAAVGFVFNYTAYGITTGNWGWKALAASGSGAVSGWFDKCC